MRGHLHRLFDLVGKAEFDGFGGGDPSFFGHHPFDFGGFHAGFRLVGGDHAGLELVEGVGHFAHVGGVAYGVGPRIMDHQQGVGRHDDAGAGHGDDGGHGQRHPFDVNVDLPLMPAHGVIDGVAGRNGTAGGIDAQVKIAEGLDGVDEFLGGHVGGIGIPLVIDDDAEDEDLGADAGGGIGGFDFEPAGFIGHGFAPGR